MEPSSPQPRKDENMTDPPPKLDPSDADEQRSSWSNHMDFLMSCVGYAVGLGNVWRFPYLCYQNGGGLFLIPYIFMLIMTGLFHFFSEASLGIGDRCHAFWKICSKFKGIGYGMLVISFLVSVFYREILGYVIFYLFSGTTFPWASCGDRWNTDSCVSERISDNNSIFNISRLFNPKRPSAEDFYRVLGISGGVEEVSIKWKLAMFPGTCFLASFIVSVCSPCLIKRIDTLSSIIRGIKFSSLVKGIKTLTKGGSCFFRMVGRKADTVALPLLGLLAIVEGAEGGSAQGNLPDAIQTPEGYGADFLTQLVMQCLMWDVPCCLLFSASTFWIGVIVQKKFDLFSRISTVRPSTNDTTQLALDNNNAKTNMDEALLSSPQDHNPSKDVLHIQEVGQHDEEFDNDVNERTYFSDEKQGAVPFNDPFGVGYLRNQDSGMHDSAVVEEQAPHLSSRDVEDNSSVRNWRRRSSERSELSAFHSLTSHPEATARDGELVRANVDAAMISGAGYHLEDIPPAILNKLGNLNKKEEAPIQDARSLPEKFCIPQQVWDRFNEQFFFERIIRYLTSHHPGKFSVCDLLGNLVAIERLDMAAILAYHVLQGHLKADCPICQMKRSNAGRHGQEL